MCGSLLIREISHLFIEQPQISDIWPWSILLLFCNQYLWLFSVVGLSGHRGEMRLHLGLTLECGIICIWFWPPALTLGSKTNPLNICYIISCVLCFIFLHILSIYFSFSHVHVGTMLNLREELKAEVTGYYPNFYIQKSLTANERVWQKKKD